TWPDKCGLTVSLEFARALGNRGEREFKGRRGDSPAPQQTATARAWISCSFLVTVSTSETARTLASLSTNTSRATLFGISVKLPVFWAFGSIESGTVKMAPTSHPSMQCPQ